MSILKAIILSTLLLNSHFLYASSAAEKNRAFNWGESRFSTLFAPAQQETSAFEQWTYRYYDQTDNYLGINEKDEVYILGASTKNELTFVATLSDINQLIEKEAADFSNKVLEKGDLAQCKQIPLFGTLGKGLEMRPVKTIDSDDPSLYMEMISKTEDSFTLDFKAYFSLFSSSAKKINLQLVANNKEIIMDDQAFNRLTVQDIMVDGETVNLDSDFNIKQTVLLLPVSWCQGMQWQLVVELPDQESIRLKNTVLSVDDSVTLANGKKRNAIKIEILIDDALNTGKRPTAFVWLDIQTGYIIKLEAEDDIILALSIKDSKN